MIVRVTENHVDLPLDQSLDYKFFREVEVLEP
jgi:hypothetical protein